jgi:hypothetical protein
MDELGSANVVYTFACKYIIHNTSRTNRSTNEHDVSHPRANIKPAVGCNGSDGQMRTTNQWTTSEARATGGHAYDFQDQLHM